MKTKFQSYLILFSIVVLSIGLLQSFKKPTSEYVSIVGVWENFTLAKDENGKEIKKEGKSIYRKIKLRFIGAGTAGEVDGLKKTYNMSNASGKVNFVESFGYKEKKYKNKDDQEIMNYGLQVNYRQAKSGYYFDSDNLNLKVSCGELKILNQKTNEFVEFKKGDENFNAIQNLLDKIKITKLTTKKLSTEWDYNNNGKIDDDERMVFEAVE